jgi:hypothetical protein
MTEDSKLDNDLTTKRVYLRYLSETLFSLNLGLALAIGLRVYVSQFPAGRNGFSDFFVGVASGTNGILRLVQGDRAGVDIAFLALTGGVALVLFLLLRLSASIGVGRPILNVAGGIVAIGALPTCWLYIERALDPVSSSPWAVWLLFVGTGAVCVSLYSRDRWPFPIWSTVPVLTLYFSFWGWMLLQHLPHDPVGFVLPALGLCSSLVWGVFVTKRRTDS